MLLRILEWTAAAGLALASVPVLAADTCRASVCEDPTWPAMEVAAPAFALEQIAETGTVEELIATHSSSDETIVDHEESPYIEQLASLDDVLEEMNEAP